MATPPHTSNWTARFLNNQARAIDLIDAVPANWSAGMEGTSQGIAFTTKSLADMLAWAAANPTLAAELGPSWPSWPEAPC